MLGPPRMSTHGGGPPAQPNDFSHKQSFAASQRGGADLNQTE